MVKTQPANQIGLFPASDDVAQHTRESTDEIEWKKERKRRSKRNQVKANPIPVTGSCCGRCARWRAPHDDEPFGSCRIRVVTTERVTGFVESGQCLEYDMGTDTLWLGPGLPLPVKAVWDYQRCGPAYTCSSFTAAAEIRGGRMTITLLTGETIDPAMVRRMVETMPVTASPRRTATERELLNIGVKVHALVEDLAGADGNSGRLGAGMDFLDAQEPNVDTAREALWMDWLGVYQDSCDLLATIEAGLRRRAA